MFFVIIKLCQMNNEMSLFSTRKHKMRLLPKQWMHFSDFSSSCFSFLFPPFSIFFFLFFFGPFLIFLLSFSNLLFFHFVSFSFFPLPRFFFFFSPPLVFDSQPKQRVKTPKKDIISCKNNYLK